MKRKLKINRETLRNLMDQETREAAGGASLVISQCVTCLTCYRSCGGTCALPCTLAYSACVHCQL
jgi:hypothetical protein